MNEMFKPCLVTDFFHTFGNKKQKNIFQTAFDFDFDL